MPAYIPEQGDIIAITFDPQSGHEQKGRRLAPASTKLPPRWKAGSLKFADDARLC